MEDLVRDTLVAAGDPVEVENASYDVVTRLQEWIDPENIASPWSMEDCAPLDPEFYKRFARILEYAWTSNAYSLEMLQAQEALHDTVDAVRVTKWLVMAMDQHVSDEASFTVQLLRHNTGDPNLMLLPLFVHIASLPQLQQQIHYWTQTARQRTSASNRNAAARLQHYQATQQKSEELQHELEQHTSRLGLVLGEWYRNGTTALRTTCRTELGLLWRDFGKRASRPTARSMENSSATGVRMTLQVLFRILQGIPTAPLVKAGAERPVLLSSYRHLLFHQLLPLHAPSTMLLWRDQTALLELYHEPLVQCIGLLLQRQVEWTGSTIHGLTQPDIWPASGGAANTPKTILLLHEIDTYLGLLHEVPDDSSILDDVTWQALLARLVSCLTSDNSRASEQALQFFRNNTFRNLIFARYDESMPLLLRTLVRTEVPWNPTVRKMTYYVLLQLQQQDKGRFTSLAQQVFGDMTGNIGQSTAEAAPPQRTSAIPKGKRAESSVSPTAMPHDFSLKSGMGDWRPPSSTRANSGRQLSRMGPTRSLPPRSRGKAPPLTVTGVAPWANKSNGAPPPLTNTGVAPWVSSQSSTDHSTNSPPQKRDAGEARLEMGMEALKEDQNDETAGLAYVLSYMERLKPEQDDDGNGTSSWAKAQMAESPVLLPSLKFHDLVFGHELGAGSFGSVKYARLIVREKTRSQWPEYAVKIVSTKKIVELGYEASVQREIAILRMLSHPCIARLISSFRFHDGAYLVLEYAGQGDLHTLLRQHGSLDEESTRFVIGEIVAALASIHDLGLAYVDLKPENILITETGHIKLTDFGGCRPVTEESRQRVRESGKDLLSQLRDGDWKRPTKSGEESAHFDEVSIDKDVRIEGTTAYLPPEVVLGSIPTTASDSWALGCVLYQCLSGRPPLIDKDDETTRSKIVSFQELMSSNEDPLFADKHAHGISSKARQLIRRLLSRDPVVRPSMTQIAEDAFFYGTNVFRLHQEVAPSLDVGSVEPSSADSQWSRRQFSSIWAPQPKAYDLTGGSSGRTDAWGSAMTNVGPIPEGDEGGAFFSTSRNP